MEKVKQKRNATVSRENILMAAMAEFSEHGYNGARIDRIVKRAAVSKNLAYHYFDSKEDLFLQVMERMYARMRQHHSDLKIQGMSPVDGMKQLVRHTYAHFVEYPEVISLLNTENLHKAVHIKGSKRILELYDPLTQVIGDLLNRGVTDGVFRKGVDPMQLYITISGLGYFYLSNQFTLGTVFRTELVSSEQLKVREEHIIDVVLGYLRP